LYFLLIIEGKHLVSETFSKTVLYCSIGSKNLKTIWKRVNDALEEKVSKAAVIEEVNRIYSRKADQVS
jgi:hypothetical protein